MITGWRYRAMAVLGVAIWTAFAVIAAKVPAIQVLVQYIPLFAALPADTATGAELAFEIGTALVIVSAAFLPLYKPRPRRILDTIMLVQRRTFLAVIAMAAIGYFDYTYRLPRLTVIIATPLLFILLPAWFVAIRERPADADGRTIIVGDDPDEMADVLAATDLPIVGYVSPPSANRAFATGATKRVADGGTPSLDDLVCLGGLSRLEEVLVEHDVDTAILAFSQLDRAEFFGTLDACFDHGVRAKVHRDHADSVLTTEFGDGELVDVDLEPWDWQDHVIKRLFDVAFATTALLVLSPVMLVIAAAIKLDDGGSVFYAQERTAVLGDTFSVSKFRTMCERGEDSRPVDDDGNGRITDVGCFLRRTHLDEIPQLWTILLGRMSVVGPRAAWTEEEVHLEAEVTGAWRKRWFVKPGLTGLAQINDVSSVNPADKLRYDVEYIRRQSFWFDLKIVIRQLALVGEDAFGLGEDDR